MNKKIILLICILMLVLSLGIVIKHIVPISTDKTDWHKEYKGIDLTRAPKTTNWGNLPDLFEDRPHGSLSFHLRNDIILIYEKGQTNTSIFYIPKKDSFYIQRDPLNSSTLTYFGPFKGDPRKMLRLNNPQIKDISLENN